jgi:hypothetical protein
LKVLLTIAIIIRTKCQSKYIPNDAIGLSLIGLLVSPSLYAPSSSPEPSVSSKILAVVL